MRKTRTSLFLLLAVLQLFVAGKMIFDRQHILNEGAVYKFIMQPVDPNDPFRGKYLTMGFDTDHVDLYDSAISILEGETYPVLLATDEKGYAVFSGISESMPAGDYLNLKVQQVYERSDGQTTVYFEMPFNRYYLNEENVELAEELLQAALADSTHSAYATVRVLDGNAVLEDLVLDEESISDLLSE